MPLPPLPYGIVHKPSIDDLEKKRIVKATKEQGAWPPPKEWRDTNLAQALEAGKLLPAPMLAQATAPQNHNRWYGLGFMVYPDDPAPSYGHEGGAPGMNADLRIFPDQRTIIVCLSNLDPMGADTLTNFYALRMPIR